MASQRTPSNTLADAVRNIESFNKHPKPEWTEEILDKNTFAILQLVERLDIPAPRAVRSADALQKDATGYPRVVDDGRCKVHHPARAMGSGAMRVGDVWAHMGKAERATLLGQLKAIVAKLRTVEDTRPVELRGRISAYDSVSPALQTHRRNETRKIGPYPVLDLYRHEYGYADVERRDGRDAIMIIPKAYGGAPPGLHPALVDVLSVDWRTAFAHGHLNPDALWCDRAGHIVEIGGWECAGYWPEWYEAVRCVYRTDGGMWVGWRDAVVQAGVFDEEVKKYGEGMIQSLIAVERAVEGSKESANFTVTLPPCGDREARFVIYVDEREQPAKRGSSM